MNSDNFVYADVLMCYGFEGKEPLCKPYILNDVLFKLDENHFISLKHVKKERDLIIIERKKFKNGEILKDIVLGVKPDGYGLFVDKRTPMNYFIEYDEIIDFKALKKAQNN